MLVAFTDFLTLASSAIGLLLTTMLGLIFRQRRSGTVIVTPLKPALIAKKRAPQGGTNGDSEVFLTAAELVARYCPSLSSSSFTSYRPSWWLPGGHLQTFYCVAGNFNEIDKVDYVRTTLRLPDGGTVSADVSPPDHTSLPDDAPTVIIAHGLTGGSHESYVRNVVEWIVRPRKEGGLGGRAVVANFRGCANTPVTSNQFYSAGYTGDYHTVVSRFASLYPDSPLVGIGFSLGASVVARYVGEQGDRCLLRGACVLGCPWDIPAMSRTLETGWFSSRVYSHAMAKNLIRTIGNHLPGSRSEPRELSGSSTPSSTTSASSEGSSGDVTPLAASEPDLSVLVADVRKRGRNMRLKDVDDAITCQFGGLRKDNMRNEMASEKAAFPLTDADAYYDWASSKPFIAHAKRPLLGINALDDPVVSGQSLPVDEVSASSHAVLAVTSYGGHLGWFDGPFFGGRARPRQKRWIIKPIAEYVTALLDHTEDESPRRTVEREADGWSWVEGSERDTYGRVGWREVEDDRLVSGAESSGVLQGL